MSAAHDITISRQAFDELHAAITAIGRTDLLGEITALEAAYVRIGETRVFADHRPPVRLGGPVRLSYSARERVMAAFNEGEPPVRVKALALRVKVVDFQTVNLLACWCDAELQPVVDLGSLNVDSGSTVTLSDIDQTLIFRIS